MSATSRDPEAYARATERARETRAEAAAEVAQRIADQVAELIVEGDIMGGRALAVRRIRELAAAEATGDRVLVRAAVMELVVAGGAWAASLDLGAPEARQA